MDNITISKGFIVKRPWADLILSKKKNWEIRGSNCKKRGFVGLIAEGKWIGNVEIIGCRQISLEEYQNNISRHNVSAVCSLPYPKTFAWEIGKVIKFDVPREYFHKKGCVIWVNL